MQNLYESFEETQTRLTGSVFMYKDQVVYCDMVENAPKNGFNLHLVFYPMARERAIIPLSDPDLNYRRFNIGYINMAPGATYMTRLPARGHYKQGLYGDNVSFSKISSNFGTPNWGTVLQQAGFKDMLLGLYPSLPEAIERLKDGDRAPSSVAFSREFALAKDKLRGDYILMYKASPVAFGSEEFQLAPEHQYLREVIQQAKIKVR